MLFSVRRLSISSLSNTTAVAKFSQLWTLSEMFLTKLKTICFGHAGIESALNIPLEGLLYQFKNEWMNESVNDVKLQSEIIIHWRSSRFEIRQRRETWIEGLVGMQVERGDWSLSLKSRPEWHHWQNIQKHQKLQTSDRNCRRAEHCSTAAGNIKSHNSSHSVQYLSDYFWLYESWARNWVCWLKWTPCSMDSQCNEWVQ